MPQDLSNLVIVPGDDVRCEICDLRFTPNRCDLDWSSCGLSNRWAKFRVHYRYPDGRVVRQDAYYCSLECWARRVPR